MSTAPTTRPRTLRPSVRKALLTVHIIVSVGLLGDSAGFLAVAVRGATTTDAGMADASYQLLRMFRLMLGIPLSFAALITGLILALGGRWGVLRTAKLLLILSVIAVAALVLDPALKP